MSDEDARDLQSAHAQASMPPVADGRLGMAELSRSEALRLLAGVSLGRIVFTQGPLPAIRPVNHALIDGHIVILIHPGAALGVAASGPGVVVAYEADQIDLDTHVGWSVVVTGLARLATDPEQVAHYKGLLTPWVARQMSDVVLISLEMVTGFCLVADGSNRA